MKDEPPIDVQKWYKGVEVFCLKSLIERHWDATSDCWELSDVTDWYKKYYIGNWRSKDKEEFVRWDRIHGWKRKVLKFAIKKKKRAIQKQIDMWNKYVGKDNVLFIHSRIGGANWNDYGGNELEKQPWFLEKVDDYFDDTYCDIS